MRRLVILAILVTTMIASPVVAASPSPIPSGGPGFIANIERTLDVVRALDPRFAGLQNVDEARAEMAAEFDFGPVMAASWIGVLPTFGSFALDGPPTTTGDAWFGLGGSIVEVMLVRDCVTTGIELYLQDPSKGDPCAWRHTWLYQVSASGEATLLTEAGSPDTQ